MGAAWAASVVDPKKKIKKGLHILEETRSESDTTMEQTNKLTFYGQKLVLGLEEA